MPGGGILDGLLKISIANRSRGARYTEGNEGSGIPLGAARTPQQLWQCREPRFANCTRQSHTGLPPLRFPRAESRDSKGTVAVTSALCMAMYSLQLFVVVAATSGVS